MFVPVAFLMGVEWNDCRAVSKFLGIKVFLNELIAYIDMSSHIKNRTISVSNNCRTATIYSSNAKDRGLRVKLVSKNQCKFTKKLN